MKFYTLLFISLLLTNVSIAQEIETDKDGYVEVPEVTAMMTVDGKAVKKENVHFKYLPEYEYKGGFVYGSYLKIHCEGIKDPNTLDGESFVFYKQEIRRKSDNKVMIATTWLSEKMNGKKEDKEDSYYFNATWDNGGDSKPGEYIWELTLIDFCTKKQTTVSAPVTIIQAANIQSSISPGIGVGSIYFWNADKEYIYAGGELFTGTYKLKVRDITGFVYEEGLYKVGVSHKLMKQDGTVIFENEDLAQGKDAYVESADGSLILSPIVELKSDVKGEILLYNVKIWDKRKEGSFINVQTTFYVK